MDAGCGIECKYRAGGDRLMANTTWNPADLVNTTLSGGNLVAATTAAIGGVRSVHSLTAGKYFWENTYTVLSSNSLNVGIALATANLSNPTTACAKVRRIDGRILVNNVDSGSSISGGSAVPAGSVIGMAVDFTAQLIWCRLGAAGQWNGSGTANPATGVGGISVASIAGALFALASGQLDTITANFGDTAFSGATPAGFISGFPALPTSMQATQAALEQWGSGTPDMRATQQALEMWASVQATAATVMIATQFAIEQWSPVASAAPPQARALILS
jgi:hypothetical protein